MLGTTFVTADASANFSGLTELPDVVAHLVTLQLQNQDGFSSQYGFRGTDYDYKLLVRNSRESPKVGFPLITRHNVEFQLTKRPTISNGVVTPAIPYVWSMTSRFPETGTQAIMSSVVYPVYGTLMATSAAKYLKTLNFES